MFQVVFATNQVNYLQRAKTRRYIPSDVDRTSGDFTQNQQGLLYINTRPGRPDAGNGLATLAFVAIIQARVKG